MRPTIILTSLLISGSPALAADWTYLATGGDGRKVYVDTSSKRRAGSNAQVWIEIDYSLVKAIRARSGRELWKFKCDEQTSFTASWIDYAANGSVIESKSPIEISYEYKPVAPGTVGEEVMNYACAQ